jgi:zinc transport system substrate-binding protein
VRRVRAFLLLLVVVGVTILSACAGCRRGGATPRLKVAVTFFPIYDLARQIAGPDADVTLLVAPGRPDQPGQASTSDTEGVTGAGLVIRVGLGLDDWLQPVIDQVAPKARRLVVGDHVPTLPVTPNALADALKHIGLPDVATHSKNKIDPYVWLDPQRGELIAKAIAEELARADVAHAAGYRARSAALEADLEALDREAAARTAAWKTRAFAPFRSTFGYFADRYHLEVAAVLEPTPGQPPPLRYDQLVALVVRNKGLVGVFREPQYGPKSASVVSVACSVPVGVLDVLGGQGGVDSYQKLIRFDLDALERVMKDPPRAAPPQPDAGPRALEGGVDL